MEMKNTLAFQMFVGMIWRRVRPPYWHSCGDADELARHRAPPAGIPLTLIAEIADVLLRHTHGAAAVQVRWNGAVWASGRLEWLAGWARL